uniref:Uncharacterized protein n=1 Tax=Tanacetum cinerariifolium TaxID=118510 RepID=A0A6L2P1X8_TANCI|nr:hypothetical protein [Tanacetum cinerariifolium]
MTNANQWISIKEIEKILAQRVANAIEAIDIYESINQTKQWENKVAGNASNKKKWEGALFTTLASVQKNVAIANGGVTKQVIVRSHYRERKRSEVSGKKAEVICYGCGGLGHYKSNSLIVKLQKRVDKYWKGKAHGDSSATTFNINI